MPFISGASRRKTRCPYFLIDRAIDLMTPSSSPAAIALSVAAEPVLVSGGYQAITGVLPRAAMACSPSPGKLLAQS